jgi:hypothetical protein
MNRKNEIIKVKKSQMILKEKHKCPQIIYLVFWITQMILKEVKAQVPTNQE